MVADARGAQRIVEVRAVLKAEACGIASWTLEM
jgi:hypothetical protein